MTDERPILVGADKMTAMAVSHLRDHDCDFPMENLTELARHILDEIEGDAVYRRAWLTLYDEADPEVQEYMDQLLGEGDAGSD